MIDTPKDDAFKENAIAMVKQNCPDGINFEVKSVYKNVMDGTLVAISFGKSSEKSTCTKTAYVHFGKEGKRYYRWHNALLNAIASHKERIFFFRLLELAGIGGVIALTLVVVFSILLSVLAFTTTTANPSVVEVVNLSFTVILGFFFGSQTGHKK
jgi:hypothetical protein